MDLVASTGAEFEDHAPSGAEEGRDTGGVFMGDKAGGCAPELVRDGVELRTATLPIVTKRLATAASRIRCGWRIEAMPSVRMASLRAA